MTITTYSFDPHTLTAHGKTDLLRKNDIVVSIDTENGGGFIGIVKDTHNGIYRCRTLSPRIRSIDQVPTPFIEQVKTQYWKANPPKRLPRKAPDEIKAEFEKERDKVKKRNAKIVLREMAA